MTPNCPVILRLEYSEAILEKQCVIVADRFLHLHSNLQDTSLFDPCFKASSLCVQYGYEISFSVRSLGLVTRLCVVVLCLKNYYA